MTFDPTPYLRSTRLLDFDADAIRSLVITRAWASLDLQPRIAAVYSFVRDEIGFGYNRTDETPASAVLSEGFGQCNTKTTLLMALLRAVKVPCRAHGATIHKALQKGVVTGVFYWLAPSEILHSWAEVWLGERWVALEGVILDKPYLSGVATFAKAAGGPFLGYGVGTESIQNPPIDFVGSPTCIQMTGVARDFGAFDDPDAFYAAQSTNMSGPRQWLFERWVRHRMNTRVSEIRALCRVPATPR